MSRTRPLVALLSSVTLATSGLLALATPAQAHERRGLELEAELSGANEVPAGDPDGAGEAEVELQPGLGRVCFEIEVEDIGTPLAAHIHAAPAGVNGPVVVNFMVDQLGLDGCVSADRALIRQIRRTPAQYYVNVHTAEFPGGAVRGQLERD